MQATLTSTDRFEFQPDEANDPLFDAAVLSWLEIPSAKGGQSTAKYMAERRGLEWLPKQQFSLNNGAAENRVWNPDPTKLFIGDYSRGSFFFGALPGGGSNKSLHFISTWPQSQASPSPNLSLHSNIVNWSEP